MLWINRLNRAVISAAIANLNTKNPTVAISIIKQTPAIISHICQGTLKLPPYSILIHTHYIIKVA